MTDDKMTNWLSNRDLPNCSRRNLLDLSQRDSRTQPGVLTPGSVKKTVRPEGAPEDIGPASRSSMYGSGTTICRPFRARSLWMVDPGLKPRAESYCPFGTRSHPAPAVSTICHLSFVIRTSIWRVRPLIYAKDYLYRSRKHRLHS